MTAPGAGISWCPWRHLNEWYPDVRVIEDELPGSILGCMEHERRTIWLSDSLTDGQRRATLAYQIGQLELGPFDRDRGDGGMVADWASRLLIPFEELLRAVQSHGEPSEIAEGSLIELAEELSVDPPMLMTRLGGLSEREWEVLRAHPWVDLT